MTRLNSRRSFLRNVAAATTVAASTSFRANPSSRRKPNLLFLWTDEQRADTIDVYGNRRIQSPNLAKLAQESIVFRNAYVSQPVCTPSRATVMTGLWPHQSGCTQNNIALPEKTPTLPELVADGDYRTGYFGKWHLGDEIFAQHGFEEWRSIEDMYWSYYREGRDTEQKSDYHHWLKSLGYEPDTDRSDFSRGFAAGLPIEHCKPKFLEKETCAFLRRHRDEPFMLFVNFLEPHMPFTGPLNSLHRLDEVELPPNFDDPLEENEPETYRQRVRRYTDGLYAGEFDLTQVSEWRRLVAHYWGLVSQVDRSVGIILEELERLGLADHTLVVFTSDHGDMMASHRLIEKSIMYQEALRVPWLMRIPDRPRRQYIVEGHVSQIDLVPTLLELLGKDPRQDLPGRSLVPLLKEQTPAAEPVFVQWNAPQEMQKGRNPAGAYRNADRVQGPCSRAVITPEGWKLCLHDSDRNQLFNLAKDPGETTNLYDRAESRQIIRELDGHIRNWQERIGDSLQMPEPD